DQANLLGYPREALMLAKAGQRGMRATGSNACLADLYILEARAQAALGRSAEASAAVVRAEETFAKVARENEPAWARAIDEAYLFGEAARCFRDLRQHDQAERFATQSATAAARQKRARRGALSNATLAVAELQRKNVEGAAVKA